MVGVRGRFHPPDFAARYRSHHPNSRRRDVRFRERQFAVMRSPQRASRSADKQVPPRLRDVFDDSPVSVRVVMPNDQAVHELLMRASDRRYRSGT